MNKEDVIQKLIGLFPEHTTGYEDLISSSVERICSMLPEDFPEEAYLEQVNNGIEFLRRQRKTQQSNR